MVVFKPAERENLAGAPRIDLPPALVEWLDQTYRDRTVCELAVPHDQVPEFIRLCRIHAARRELTISYRMTWKDQAEHLEFRMKDKRPYNRQDQP